MVPKHRRSDNPPLASVGAPANRAEFWPEVVGYGQSAATAGPSVSHPRVGSVTSGYLVSYDDDGTSVDPDWAGPDGDVWQEWEAWAPRPILHPDHPSAQLPRVQLPADHPSGPMPVPRAFTAQSPPGPGRAPGSGRHEMARPAAPTGYVGAVPAGDAWAHQVHHEVRRYQRQPGLPRRDANGYQLQTGPGWQDSTDYRRETGPFGPGPATGEWFQNGHSPNGDSLGTTGQVRQRANGHVRQIAQQPRDEGSAMREAAEREAAAIREAAEQEAAEMRARLETMLADLNRMAPQLADGLAAPAMPATDPGLPRTRPALPRQGSGRPATAPVRPRTVPATRPAGPARPRAASAGQTQTTGRQRKVMRAFAWATAGLVAFATIAGATEIAEHGFGFFAFRAGGFGETPGSITDQQFEAHQVNIRGNPLPVAHTATAPTGKHHKPSS